MLSSRRLSTKGTAKVERLVKYHTFLLVVCLVYNINLFFFYTPDTPISLCGTPKLKLVFRKCLALTVKGLNRIWFVTMVVLAWSLHHR